MRTDNTTVYATHALEPHSDGPVTAIERLSALAPRTTYRVPLGSHGTRSSDYRHDLLRALASVPDRIGAETALAIAAAWPGHWERVSRLANAELADPRSDLGAVVARAARRWRVKLVLFDAFVDLASGRMRTQAASAKEIGMRRHDYADLYTWLYNTLHARATGAARDALRALAE